ncbi:Bug family tripartite tricarboxylate transporter substrate binding protein [Allorhizobium pseudoryzae]|uniref:Bug family tripartite tricarboxylate transporter substrate binding protein n=1 Tax=Allorhizobium pseudoryzae TaxID=379684 RepID=UPI003D04B152
MTIRTAFRFAALAISALTIGLGSAKAQEFPSQPITFVVPYAPGGISDILGRAVSASLQQQLGQPVVVVNKPSPGIVLGLSEVANAKPDGYTIGIWSNAAYVFPIAMKQQVPYDGVEGFTFLRSYGEFVVGAVVAANSPYKTFQDLVDAGKKDPGKLKYGSIGVNSGQHLQLEAAARHFGAKFVHIPQTGTAANISNVLGGHLDFLSDASSWTPNVKQGQMRLLAISGTKRNPYFPDVPTYKELGVQEEYWGRGAIVAAAGIPADVRGKLETALDKAFQDPKVQEAVSSIAQAITSIPGADMTEWAKSDREFWKKSLASN